MTTVEDILNALEFLRQRADDWQNLIPSAKDADELDDGSTVGQWRRLHALLASLPADGVIVTAPQAAFAEAWEAAEKACPEGWHLSQVCAPLRSAPSQWAVIAAPDDWNGPDSVNAYGPTPTAALVALREKLEEMG